jgi:hypothetical protein
MVDNNNLSREAGQDKTFQMAKLINHRNGTLKFLRTKFIDTRC